MISETQRAREVAQAVRERASAAGKRSAFTIASTAHVCATGISFQSVRETPSVVSGTVLVDSDEAAQVLATAIDGEVDLVFVDAESKRAEPLDLVTAVRAIVRESDVITLLPNLAAAQALDQLVAQERPDLRGETVVVVGAGHLGSRAGLLLAERGATVVLTRRDAARLEETAAGLRALLPDRARERIRTTSSVEAERFHVLIGCTPGIPAVTEAMVERIEPEGLLVDAGEGTLWPAALACARGRGILVTGLYVRPALAGQIEAALGMKRLTRGRRELAGVPIVAGGYLGERGDILVDHLERPTRPIAVVDGRGDTLPRDRWLEVDRERWGRLTRVLEREVSS